MDPPLANLGQRGFYFMKMNDQNYGKYVDRVSPSSPIGKDCFNAFWIGGLICLIAQVALSGYKALGLDQEGAATTTCMTMILLAAILTGFSIYDDIAKIAGAGTLVPITGFANSIVAPAVEFRSEKIITGTCAKMFSIAGPVIVFGLSASVVYGLIYWIFTM